MRLFMQIKCRDKGMDCLIITMDWDGEVGFTQEK
jgi:hypothetical protein